MSKKTKASVLNMIERERHRVAATVTQEQDWEQPEPNNGLARMFVIMLLIHVFVIGGIIIYDFVGGDSTPKATQASGSVSPARATSTSTAASLPASVPVASQPPLAAPRSAIDTTPKQTQTPPAAPPVPKATPYVAAGTPATHSPVVVAKATITSPNLPSDNPAVTRPAPAISTTTELPAPEKPKPAVNKPKPVVADSPPSATFQPKPVATPSVARKGLESDTKPALAAKKKDKDSTPDAPPSKKEKAAKPLASHAAIKHIVAKGDTFYGLAHRYKISEEAIMKANGIKSSNSLVLGKTITIPASK